MRGMYELGAHPITHLDLKRKNTPIHCAKVQPTVAETHAGLAAERTGRGGAQLDGGARCSRAVWIEQVEGRVHLSVLVVHPTASAEAAASHKHAAIAHEDRAAVVCAGLS